MIPLPIPAILKLVIIFLIIALSIKFKLPLAIAMFLGSVLIFLFFETDLSLIPTILKKSIIAFDTISLVVVVFLILAFSGLLKISGRLDLITKDFEEAFGGGSAFFIMFPSIIGLLPMPGGAIFSAPMIEQKGLKEGFSPERLSAVNFWFRHIWEFMWFLYPGVIISSSIFGISPADMFIHHFPLTIFAMIFGWLFLLHRKVSSKSSINWKKIPSFIFRLMPIIMLVVSNVIIRTVVSVFELGVPDNIVMALCLIGSIVYVLIKDKPNWKELAKVIFTKKIFSMLSIIFLIFLFKETLTQTGAVSLTADEIQEYNLPFMLILIILPFVVGLLMGITIGFVSTFVVIESLLSTFPSVSVYSALVLAYTSGIAGIYLSPVHICLILTKDYYGATLLGTLKKIIIPVLLIMLIAIGLYFLYNLI